MPRATDKFKVSIVVNVEKITGDTTSTGFSRTSQEYVGLDYIQMQQLQNAIFSALVPALLELGNASADEVARSLSI